jgi:hypothetical protein
MAATVVTVGMAVMVGMVVMVGMAAVITGAAGAGVPASVSQSGLAITGAGDAGQTIMAAGFRADGCTATATKSLACGLRRLCAAERRRSSTEST